MDKQTLRKIIKERKATASVTEHRQWSAVICHKLLHHPRITNAQTVLLYYPLPDEPDIRDLIQQLQRQGKRVLLPEVTGPETMVLRVYHGEKSLTDGALGTLYPTGEEFILYDEITTAIIPGVAFDHNGNRMGRGKGYYDRFLLNINNAYLIGTCFPYQLVDEIPIEPTDIPMNEVVCG